MPHETIFKTRSKAMSPNKDVGIFAVRTLSWLEVIKNLGTASGQPTFIEFSFKDAKQVKGKQ